MTTQELDQFHSQSLNQIQNVASRISLVIEETKAKNSLSGSYQIFLKNAQNKNISLDAFAQMLSLRQRQEYVTDSIQHRVRINITDLRDLRAIEAYSHVPAEGLQAYSHSGVSLQNKKTKMGLFWVQMLKSGPEVSLEYLPDGSRTVQDPPLEFGSLDPDVLKNTEAGTEKFEEVNSGDDVLIQMTALYKGNKLRVLLDPNHGYKYRLVEFSTPAGRLRSRKKADDYRTINGIDYPFAQSEELYDESSGELLYNLIRKVESAEFNINVSDEDFTLSIPQGTAIVNRTMGYPLIVEYVNKAYSLTLGQLHAFAIGLREEVESSGKLDKVNLDSFLQQILASPVKITTRPSDETSMHLQKPALNPASVSTAITSPNNWARWGVVCGVVILAIVFLMYRKKGSYQP